MTSRGPPIRCATLLHQGEERACVSTCYITGPVPYRMAVMRCDGRRQHLGWLGEEAWPWL